VTLTEANRQAQATWNNQACGARSPEEGRAESELEPFWSMAARRYDRFDPWVPAVLDFPAMRDKQVLEIGHGMGCDLAHAAMAGAKTHGLDLTQNHHEIAKRYFAELSLEGDFRLGNAGSLPFADESMDIVYSLGVLHHTDNTIRCIGEAYRVLKPGGTLIFSMYHFWSIPHLYFLVYGAWKGHLRRLGYRRYMSTIERGADGVNIAPLVKLYTKRKLRTMLEDFASVEITVHGLDLTSIPIARSIVPNWGVRLLAKRWGWYLVARGLKL
jgi:ubiquinone/menaquinone biosynthesis C-methylase UbiE